MSLWVLAALYNKITTKLYFQVQPHFQSEIVPQYDEKTFTMCLFSGLQAVLPYLATISRLVFQQIRFLLKDS
jgi:hypothetical protein